MNIARSAAKLFFANIAKSVILFTGTITFARILGPSDIGLFFLFQGAIVVLSLFTDVGLRSSMEKRISEGAPQEKVLTTTALLKVLPFLFMITILFILKHNINEYFGINIISYIVFGLLSYEIFMFSVKALSGQLRVGETAGLYVIQYITWVIIGYVLLILGLGIKALLIGFITGILLSGIIGFLRLSTAFGEFSTEIAYSLIHFSRYDFIAFIRGQSYNWTDVLVIGYFLTHTSVGSYEIAWRITAVVMLLSHSIATVIFPQMSNWSGEDAISKIEAVIPRIITPSMFFVIPSFFGAIVLSKEILVMIFGKEFQTAWLILIILMLDKVVESLQIIFDRSLRGLNRPDLAAIAAVVSIVFNIGMNVWLVWAFGAIGAAIATLCASVLGIGFYGYYLRKLITVTIPYREILWCSFASIVMATSTFAMKNSMGIKTINHLIVVIIFSALIYFLIIFAPGQMRKKLGTIVDYGLSEIPK